MMIYRGWRIAYNVYRGCWEASRFGVTICSTREDALPGMIDQHIQDNQDWFEERSRA